MKKFLLKTWLLLACLLLGVGSAWAESETTTFTNKDWNPWTNITSGSSFESSNSARGVANNGVDGACSSSSTYSKVTKVEVVCSSNTTGGKVAISIGTQQIADKSVANSNNQTLTFDSNDYSDISSLTGKIYLNVTKPSSKTVWVKSVTITYSTDGGGSTPTVTAPKFDVAAGTYTGEQLVLIDNYNINYLYAYTLDGTDPAFDDELNVTNGTEYDENDGIEITSSCTLKAIAIDEDGNTSSITSAAYVILPKLTSIAVSGTPTKTSYYAGDAFDPSGLIVTGTYSDASTAPITEGIDWTFDPETLTLGTTSVDVLAGVGSVVSAVYTVTGLTVTENPYKTATISSFDATSGDINSDISYEAFKGNSTSDPYINDGALRLYQNGGYVTITALTGLKIASVKITTSATYASTTVGYCVDDNDAPTSGETVAKSSDYTINGLNNKAVSIYCLGTDKNTRLEIAAIEVKYSGTVVTELKSIALSGSYPTEFTQDDTFSHEGMIVTATYTDNTTDDVTADATFSGYDMSALGEQTVTVSYTENGITKTADYAITVSKAPFVPTIVPEGYESVDFTTLEPYKSLETNQSATVADYEGTSFALAFAKPQSSTTPTKYYDNGKAVRAYTGNTITITAAENIKNVFVDYASGYYDDAATITGLDTKTAVITFSKTCRFYGITVNYTVNTIDLTAQEDGIYYATFSNNETVYFSNDAEVNTVNVKSGAMTLAKVVNNIVPASTGVLLSTTSATASYYRAASHTESLSNNMLKPASETMTGDYLFYKLAYGNWENKTGLGFYYGAADGAAFTAKAGGAYLAVPTSAGARAGYAFNGDEADGLEAIELNEAATIYTLDGTQINELRKGLNIVNGKKIFVK